MGSDTKIRDFCKACEVKEVLTGGLLYFVEGMDHAIVGVGVRSGRPCVVYDRAKVLDTIMDTGMTYSDAERVMEQKIEGISVGRSTPVFLIPCEAKHIHMARRECDIQEQE